MGSAEPVTGNGQDGSERDDGGPLRACPREAEGGKPVACQQQEIDAKKMEAKHGPSERHMQPAHDAAHHR